MLTLAILLLLTLHSNHAVRVLKSQLELADYGKSISGAHLIDNRRISIQDITLCIRFNFKLLGEHNGRSQLIHIQDWKQEPGVNIFKIIPS